MSTKANYKPKNATPTKLQLEPPVIPRLPFSSPMGEEILSPTSPNSRTPPQERKGKFEMAKAPEHETNRQRDQNPESPRKRKENEAARSKKLPGLNLVTTFPPRTTSNQTTRDVSGSRPSLRDSSRPGASRTKEGTSSGPQMRHGQQPSIISNKSVGSKGRLRDLRRADSKMSTLSPSDRAVMIGISLPQDEVAEHAISAVSPEKDGARNLGFQLARDGRTSVTPSIVITPAKDVAPWSAEVEETKPSPPRPRARSSVYSQGPGLNNVVDFSIAPPVPALPPEAKTHNLQATTSNDRPAKVMSTCTIIDEDEDPAIRARGRPASVESQIRVLHRSSVDTLATRPHSQGWWNNIMSPFWPKSPMSFKAPPLPSPKNLSPSAHHRHTLSEEDDHTPLNKKADDLESKHTSWTDSPVAEEHAQPALTFDQILPGATRSVTALQPEHGVPNSSIIPARFEGFGAAAEYYEACIYDEHCAIPYFECQNHACLPREFEANGIREDDVKMSTMRGLGLEEVTSDASKGEESRGMAGYSAPKIHSSPTAHHGVVSPMSGQRPMSDATIIEDLDETPDVQVAREASIFKAPEPVPMARPAPIQEELEPEEPVVQKREAYRTPPPPPPPPAPAASPVREFRPATPAKRYVAVMPPDPSPLRNYEEPISPEPITPGPQTQAPKNALPLRDLRGNADVSRPPQDTYIVNHNYYGRDVRHSGEQTSMADFFPPPKKEMSYPSATVAGEKEKGSQNEQGKRKEEKNNQLLVKEPQPSMLSKLRNLWSRPRKTGGTKDGKMSKKKKRLVWLITAGLIGMIILILILVLMLHRRGDKMAVQSQWLNITGYPPMPTGVLTIAQPNLVDDTSNCVSPETLWSCALPKEEQQNNSPSQPDQPNFRVEIRFQNGTNATSSINSTSNSKRSDSVVNAASSGSFIRRRLLELRSALPSSLYTPSPSPPSQEDQSFLGNTTDGNRAPFDGEYTPFLMTFDSAAPLPSSTGLAKRSGGTSTTASSSTNTSDPFPNLTSTIPAASTNPNGTAAPANLYPFPYAQPLRLFDRGLTTEYYGFYSYYDRSIFLKSTGFFNGSYTPVPDDNNGGTFEDSAKVRCTWSQTRFLVQVWTNKAQTGAYPLLAGNSTQHSLTGSNDNATTSLANSSANDFSRPGSFPYPVTITLDRHGGDVKTKNVYCYGMDDSEKPTGDKKVVLEDRGVGGKLVNPAQGPFGAVKVGLKEGGPGGIDGGTGGCGCRWRNWG